MRTNMQEAFVSAYIAAIGKRTPRDAAQDAAELCRFANSLNRLNEIACDFGRRGESLSDVDLCLSPLPLTISMSGIFFLLSIRRSEATQ
jgi:hypothetical protein